MVYLGNYLCVVNVTDSSEILQTVHHNIWKKKLVRWLVSSDITTVHREAPLSSVLNIWKTYELISYFKIWSDALQNYEGWLIRKTGGGKCCWFIVTSRPRVWMFPPFFVIFLHVNANFTFMSQNYPGKVKLKMHWIKQLKTDLNP